MFEGGKLSLYSDSIGSICIIFFVVLLSKLPNILQNREGYISHSVYIILLDVSF